MLLIYIMDWIILIIINKEIALSSHLQINQKLAY